MVQRASKCMVRCELSIDWQTKMCRNCEITRAKAAPRYRRADASGGVAIAENRHFVRCGGIHFKERSKEDKKTMAESQRRGSTAR